MASESKIQMIWTSEDSRAVQTVTHLIDKAKELGGQLDVTHKKGKNTFDGLGGAISSCLGPLSGMTSIAGAAAIAINEITSSIKALEEERARSAKSAESYEKSLGGVLLSRTGTSSDDLINIKGHIDRLSGQRQIGKEGPQKLFGAYSAIEAAIPDANVQTKNAIITEMAGVLELSPDYDISTLAGTVAKVQAASGNQMNARQTLNLLRGIQRGTGLSLNTVAANEPTIVRAAGMGGLSMADTAALTREVVKTGGEDMIGAVDDIIGNLTYKSDVIREKMNKKGVAVRLNGTFFENLAELQELTESGAVSADELGDVVMGTMKGPAKKFVMERLLSREGREAISADQQYFESRRFRSADFTLSDRRTLETVMPAAKYLGEQRRTESEREARRAGRPESVRLATEQYEWEQDLLESAYGFLMRWGKNTGYRTSKMLGMDDVTARRLSSGSFLDEILYRLDHIGRGVNTKKPPQRPLPAMLDR